MTTTDQLRLHKYYVRIQDGAVCQITALSKYSVRYKTPGTGASWPCSRASFQTMFRAATYNEKRPFMKRTRPNLLAKMAELSK
jgi:hypothetical protein